MRDGELIPTLGRSELISLYVMCYLTAGPSLLLVLEEKLEASREA